MQGREGLVKLLDGVGAKRHCTACELTKSEFTCHLFHRARLSHSERIWGDQRATVQEPGIDGRE